MIARRHVFFLAGYDPFDIAAQHQRFRRQAEKFARTWAVDVAVSDLLPPSDDAGTRWTVRTRGPNWTTDTVFEPLDWHDVVVGDVARGMPRRLLTAAATFWDFLISGTAVRYFSANWRYALFFFVPFVNVLLFLAVAVLVGAAVAALVPAGGSVKAAAAIVVAVAAFALLLKWPGGRWRIGQGLEDWIFARDFMYGRRPDVERRLDGFADRVVARTRRGDADEIIVVAHSLGATMAIDVLDRALARAPDLARRGPPLCLMTVGATIPKLALHPAAQRLRDRARRIADEVAVAWVEYQARFDPISFYNFDPVALKRFVNNDGIGRPHIRLVGIKDMLEPETFYRNFWRFMRLHYQFVMANERRATYDFFMITCGPSPLPRMALSPCGATDLFAPDGAYLDAADAGAAREAAR